MEGIKDFIEPSLVVKTTLWFEPIHEKFLSVSPENTVLIYMPICLSFVWLSLLELELPDHHRHPELIEYLEAHERLLIGSHETSPIILYYY